jgi:hypothetical protein
VSWVSCSQMAALMPALHPAEVMGSVPIGATVSEEVCSTYPYKGCVQLAGKQCGRQRGGDLCSRSFP